MAKMREELKYKIKRNSIFFSRKVDEVRYGAEFKYVYILRHPIQCIKSIVRIITK